MATSFSKSPWVAFLSATALTVGVSTPAYAQARPRVVVAPNSDGPGALVIPKAKGSVKALVMTSLAAELKEIQESVKGNRRAELVDVISETEAQITARESGADGDVAVNRLQVQRDILRSVAGNTDKVLSGVQAALTAAAANEEVKKLAKGESSTPVIRTEKIADSLFDVKVTYAREGEGAEAVLKREVELVAKSPQELQLSKNASLQAIAKDANEGAAKDPRFQPVLKEAVDAVVEKIGDPVNGFLSESEVKTSDIKDEKIPVEKNLAANQSALTASIDQAEKTTSDELKTTEEKNDLALDDAKAEIERLRGKQNFAEWAKDNSAAAKQLDECGIAAMVLELTPGLEPEMLDERTKEKCKTLAASEIKKNERKVLDITALDLANVPNPAAKADPATNPLSQEQQRQAVIEQFMNTVQNCMRSNLDSASGIDKIKATFQAAYNAISGFDELQMAIKNSSIAQNVIAKMITEGADIDSAISDSADDVESLFPDSDAGNKELFRERKKLYILKGKLGYFVDEYNKRSVKMADEVARFEQQKLINILTAASAGDEGAIFERNLRAQQGLPTDPQSAFKVAYDTQMMARMNDPDHKQQMRYLQAVTGAHLQASDLYSEREERHKSGSAAWIGSQSTSAVINSTRQTLNSPTLRSNPYASVDSALSRSPTTTTVNGGSLRTGGTMPTNNGKTSTVRQPASAPNQPGSRVFR